ncbi:hypothetical protein [Neomegalonema sp.]|uniref:hypothetical protein n=1 Tax=Neomegalonema sp. TaxID=2039713 RepID=UPI00261C494E|nr:hypothetical protein [Neomegalonema sp.]MDD2870239.1 hypothetical protein [Neomegalonema sp.]
MKAVIGALRINLGLDSIQLEEGLLAAQVRLDRFAERAGRAGIEMSKRFTAPFMAAVGGIGAAFHSLSGQIKDTAQAAKISNTDIESFQKLAWAAKSVGVEQEKLGDILKDVQDKVGDFLAGGGGEMKDFFENIAPKVGVTAEQFRNLSGADALGLYVKSLQQAGISQSEMVFYMEALANDASLLAPLYADGSKELTRLSGEAEKFGLVTSDQAAASQRYSESVASMQASVRGVALALIDSGLLDAMTGLVDKFAGWVRGLKEVDAETVRWGVGLAAAAATIGPVLIGLSLMASGASALIGAFRMAGAAIATALNGIAAVFAASPILMSIAAIGTAAYLIYENWEPVKAWFAEIWDSVKEIFTGAVKWVYGLMTFDFRLAAEGGAEAWRGMVGVVSGLWTALAGTIKAVWTDILAPILDAFGLLKPLEMAWAGLTTALGLAWETIKGIFAASWEAVKPVLAELGAVKFIQEAWEGLGNFFAGLWDKIGGIFDAAMERVRRVVEWFKGAVETVTSAASRVSEATKSLGPGQPIYAAPPAPATGFFDSLRPGASPARLDGARAEGGPVRAGGSYLVGEQGPEIFTPSLSGQIIPNGGFGAANLGGFTALASVARGAAQALGLIPQAAQAAGSSASEAGSSFAGIGRTLGGEFLSAVRSVEAGAKSIGAAFKDMGRNIASSLLQSGLNWGLNTLGNLLSGGSGGAGGGGLGGLLGGLFQGGSGGGGGFFANLFGGFRAMGGGVERGVSYVVGERGPELFTPGASGAILPNDALTAGPQGGELGVRVWVDDDGRLKAVAERAGAQAAGGVVQEGLRRYHDDLPRHLSSLQDTARKRY